MNTDNITGKVQDVLAKLAVGFGLFIGHMKENPVKQRPRIWDDTC